MEKYYQKHIQRLFVILILSCLLMTSIFLFFTDKIIDYNSETVYSMELESSREEMKRLVGNLIIRIEDTRIRTTRESKDMIDLVEEVIRKNEGKEEVCAVIQAYLREVKIGKLVKVIMAEKEKENHVIEIDQNNRNVLTLGEEELIKRIQETPLHKSVETEKYFFHIMVSKEKIEEYVQEIIYDEIHHTIYGNQYIWVNEVKNYEGGEGYAVRLIHPNLKRSEGELLSTSLEDAAGNYPYETELEGINRQGEIFHTYYFENLTDDEISEKLSYARLYEPYNWIIATGEPLHDILKAANELETNTKNTAKELIVVFVIIEIALLFGVIYLQKRYQSNISIFIKQETELDGLTGAYSRKSGEKIVAQAFEKYKVKKTSYMVAVMDIDRFKEVNDTYGHTVGDQVLSQLVSKIKASIRETDYLIRWGGDEFVLLCIGVEPRLQRGIAEKVLECARKVEINTPQGKVHTTLSIGYSSFQTEDSNYHMALERVDKALYYSKEKGRNCSTDYAELTYRKE